MLAGYTANPDTNNTGVQWIDYANQVNGWLGGGRTPCTTIQKVYLQGPPASISSIFKSLIDAGCKLLISIKPDLALTTTDKTALDAYLAKLKAYGAVCDITLWQEPVNKWPTAADYITYVRFYGPTVRKYYPLVYNPQYNGGTAPKIQAWYPGDAWIDKIMVDSYSQTFRSGKRWAADVETIADAASPPKPFGIAEWGWGNPAVNDPQGPITLTDVQNYANYIAQHMSARFAAGKPCADVIYFGSIGAPGAGGGSGTISGPTDPNRGPVITVYDAITAAGSAPALTLLGSQTAITGAGTDLVITVGTASKPGAAIMVSGGVNSTALPATVSDNRSAGNVYVAAATVNAQGPAAYGWICKNPAAPVQPGDTITIHYASATASKGAFAFSSPGINALDTPAIGSAQGSSTAPSATSGTLAQAGEVVATVLISQNTGGVPTGLPGAGWTQLGTTLDSGNHKYVLLTQTASTTAAKTAAETIASAVGWSVLVFPMKSAAPPSVTTTALVPGTTGAAFAQTMTASGTAPFTWVQTGAPAPLALSAGGVWSGTPAGVFSGPVTVTVTDANGLAATAVLTLTITAPVSITTTTPLPGQTAGLPIAPVQFAAAGGTGSYTWAVSGPGSPPGLVFRSSGLLSGTPAVAAAYSFPVTATDTAGRQATVTFAVTVAVNTALGITTLVLPSVVIGQAYNAFIQTQNGTPPVTLALLTGALPPGLALGVDGTLAGVAGGAAGSFPFTVRATDSAAHTADATFTITVTSAPAPPPPQAVKSWHFLVAAPQPDGSYLDEISQAQTRTFTLRANAGEHHEIGLDMNILDVQAAALPLASDLHVMLNGKVVLICRRGAEQHNGDPSGTRVQPAALDYRELLRSRSMAWTGGPNYSNTDPADIAWGLIRKSVDPATGKTGTQGTPGGDLGIARGLGKEGLGSIYTINYNRQQYVGQAIDDLSQQGFAFDWDISPSGKAGQDGLQLDLWFGSVIVRDFGPFTFPIGSAGGRGSDNGVVIDLDAPYVQSWTRTVDPAGYANSAFFTGSGGITNTPPIGFPVSAGAVDVSDIATRPEGRWDQVIGTDYTSVPLLDNAVQWYLNNAQVVLPSYQIVMVPGWWQGPDHLWIGDTVTVRFKGGGLAVNDKVPCPEIQFDVALDNTEVLTITAGRPAFKYPQTIARALRRISRLETR